ncbi:MAG: Uma2 family endonuclease [Tetrasphaera sp.]
MTILPRSRPLTRTDLEAVPDDGHRYELIDGVLLVTPVPLLRHQRASFRLGLVLSQALTAGLEILAAPFDVVLADDTVLQPDLLVVRQADLTERNLPGAPLLAVEILSPSTRRIDLLLKRSRYESAGTPSYWVIDPAEPSIITWELRDGVYAEAGRASGEQSLTVQSPFPVTVCPERFVVP